MKNRIIFLIILFLDLNVLATNFADMLQHSCIVDGRFKHPASFYQIPTNQEYQRNYQDNLDLKTNVIVPQFSKTSSNHQSEDVTKRSGDFRRQAGVIYGNGNPIGILQPYQETFKFMPINDDNLLQVSANVFNDHSSHGNLMHPLNRYSRKSNNVARLAKMHAEKVAFMDKEYPSMLVDFKIHTKLHSPEYGSKDMSNLNNLKRETNIKVKNKASKKREILQKSQRISQSKRDIQIKNRPKNIKRANSKIQKDKDVKFIEKDLSGLLTDIGLMEDHLEDKADEMENRWHQVGEVAAEDEDLEEGFTGNKLDKIKIKLETQNKNNFIPDRRKRNEASTKRQTESVKQNNESKERQSNYKSQNFQDKKEYNKINTNTNSDQETSNINNNILNKECPKPSVIPNKRRAIKPIRGNVAFDNNEKVSVAEKFETTDDGNVVISTESYEEYEQRMAREIKEKIKQLKEEVKREIGLLKEEKASEDNDDELEESQRKKRFISGTNTLIDEESENIDPNENMEESLLPHVRKRRSFNRPKYSHSYIKRLLNLNKISKKSVNENNKLKNYFENNGNNNNSTKLKINDSKEFLDKINLSRFFKNLKLTQNDPQFNNINSSYNYFDKNSRLKIKNKYLTPTPKEYIDSGLNNIFSRRYQKKLENLRICQNNTQLKNNCTLMEEKNEDKQVKLTLNKKIKNNHILNNLFGSDKTDFLNNSQNTLNKKSISVVEENKIKRSGRKLMFSKIEEDKIKNVNENFYNFITLSNNCSMNQTHNIAKLVGLKTKNRFKRENLNLQVNNKKYFYNEKRKAITLVPFVTTSCFPYRQKNFVLNRNKKIFDNYQLDKMPRKPNGYYNANNFLIKQNHPYSFSYINPNDNQYLRRMFNRNNNYFGANNGQYTYKNFQRKPDANPIIPNLIKDLKKRRRGLNFLYNLKQRKLQDMTDEEIFGALPENYKGGLTRYKRI